MLSFFFGNQNGGAKCSLCGSEGTNKSTCPLNLSATKPNPTKHPKAMTGSKQVVKEVKKEARMAKSPTQGAKSPTQGAKSPTQGAKKVIQKTKQSKKEPVPNYLVNLPTPALESMLEQGLISYEDLSNLRQAAKGTKLATEQASVKKLAQKIKMNPSQDMINQLNDMAQKLNDLAEQGKMDTYWVDELPQQYRLTMQDVQEIRDGKKVWVFQPQIYDEIELFDNSNPEELDYFYEFQGNAVTGSGADTWGLYRPGMLEEMQKVYDHYNT